MRIGKKSSLERYLDEIEREIYGIVPDIDDRIGFTFDPYIAQEKPSYDHFMELTFLKSHQWVNSLGDVISMKDFRPSDIRYLINIVTWCRQYHEDRNPYMDTAQYKYARKKIVKLNRRIEAARKILSRPIGWSKNL